MEMRFLKERIGKMLEYLRAQIYPLSVPVTSFRMLQSEERFRDIANLDTSSWKELKRDEIWGGHREYYWFETVVTLPDVFEGKCAAFEVKTGREDAWDATNPQFSIFVNGKRVQGLDVNHREIILSECAKKGETFRIVMSAFTGDQNFHLFLDANLKVLDRKTEKYYYDLAVPYDTARLLDPESDAYIKTIQALNDSLNLLDDRREGSEDYYRSLEKAQEFITKNFYEKYGDPDKEPVICCIGHTHIDCAWLWTLRVTEDKAVRSFSTVLELMKRYPEYRFMSSQPQLYVYVKKNAPEVYEEIKKRVEEGRWEVEGGMWVEADCNLASGEGLTRQFLYGKRFFREEFGKDNEILWLPDVFGYSAALPQIMKLCGIRYFMTTKISWNETNKMPCDTFLWEGLDGTRTLTHFVPTREYHKAAEENGTQTEHYTTYNADLIPTQMKGAWERYSNKDLNQEVLCSFGYGDGGGGATAEMLENERRMSQGIPGLPRTKIAFAHDFFARLEKEVTGSRYLPTWKGELYLEYHRGTYTTMARNKKYNRQSELGFQTLETWSLANSLLAGGDYPAKEIHEAWIVILRNQFHDILPGSGIEEIYEDSKEEYDKITEVRRELEEQALSQMAKSVDAPAGSVVVFNPNSTKAPGTCEVFLAEAGEHAALISENGRKFPLQRLEDGRSLFVAEAIPSKGYATFSVGKREETQEQMEVSTSLMKNRFFEIHFNEKGQFASIKDLRANRELFPEGRAGNVIMSYEDRPHNFDAWDINNYYQEKSWEVDDVSDFRVVEEGPVRATVRIERKYLESVIVQYISIYNDLPRIDIRNEIDWKEHLILLKDHFPVDVHTNEATFDIQFGNVKRTTCDNTSWDYSKFEVCHHKWLDVAEDNFGVSFLNDCKFGVSVRGTDVGLTMLKSALYPNPEADKEHHSFTYSIFPHEDDFRGADTVGHAYALNNPMQAVVKEQAGGTLPKEFSLVSVDVPNVIIDSVKKAEDSEDMIVRLYECFNRRSAVTLQCGLPIVEASFCNLMEEEDVKANHTADTVTFEMKPYEIKTVRIRCKK